MSLAAAVFACGSGSAPRGLGTAGGGVPEPDGERGVGPGRAEVSPFPAAAPVSLTEWGPGARGQGRREDTAGAGGNTAGAGPATAPPEVWIALRRCPCPAAVWGGAASLHEHSCSSRQLLGVIARV